MWPPTLETELWARNFRDNGGSEWHRTWSYPIEDLRDTRLQRTKVVVKPAEVLWLDLGLWDAIMGEEYDGGGYVGCGPL